MVRLPVKSKLTSGHILQFNDHNWLIYRRHWFKLYLGNYYLSVGCVNKQRDSVFKTYRILKYARVPINKHHKQTQSCDAQYVSLAAHPV